MKFSPALEELMQALQELPGIGPRSAQRIAMNLLLGERKEAKRLSLALNNAVEKITFCRHCRSYTEGDCCAICGNAKRQSQGIICVVEQPADVLAVEQTGEYNGVYFVLHGRLSPLDGVGPKELHLDDLEALLKDGRYKEIILATSPTVEGDATAHFIGHIAKSLGLKASRIARGIPMGSELDTVDGSTLMRSFSGRLPL